MRLADILRTLADKMDNIESGSGNDQMAAATQGMDGTVPSPDPLMIPPLQQKLEILKKSQELIVFMTEKQTNLMISRNSQESRL